MPEPILHKRVVHGEHIMYLRIDTDPNRAVPISYIVECLSCGEIPENSEKRIPKRLEEWPAANIDAAEDRFQRAAVAHASHASMWGQIQSIVG